MTDENLDEESLRRLQAATAKLPREIVPPADAWTAIKAAIDSSQSSSVSPRPSRSAFWQRPAFLAAAALLLVAGSSVATGVFLRGRGAAAATSSVAAETAAVQRSNSTRPTSGSPATLTEFTVVENDYISTTNRLSAILESEATELSPETVAKLKQSLRIIDAAILEARRALAEDPANKQLIEMLSTSYNQKVDLLQRTTEMGRS